MNDLPESLRLIRCSATTHSIVAQELLLLKKVSCGNLLFNGFTQE